MAVIGGGSATLSFFFETTAAAASRIVGGETGRRVEVEFVSEPDTVSNVTVGGLVEGTNAIGGCGRLRDR